MQSYISTSTAALLTGEDRRRVFEKITDGVYETRKQSGGRGGNGGESYQIAVSSLPVEAQIIYAQRGGVINGPINDDCDLAGYHARFGDNGMRELLGKQRAVLEGLAIRKLNPEDVVSSWRRWPRTTARACGRSTAGWTPTRRRGCRASCAR